VRARHAPAVREWRWLLTSTLQVLFRGGRDLVLEALPSRRRLAVALRGLPAP